MKRHRCDASARRKAVTLLCALLLQFALRAPAQTAPQASLYPANRMGYLPILEYHSVGGEPEFSDGVLYDKHGLNISPETFRRQLELMYAAGWRPVTLRSMLMDRCSVARGRIPVVLTFDDSRPSQFRCLPGGAVDPNCAVGILLAFSASHPDWPFCATFYVLPESRWNGVPFDQDGDERRKLKFLLDRGCEIANHTTSHRSLADLSPRTLKWEVANALRQIRRLAPRATMDTIALPYGIAPKREADRKLLLSGRSGGIRYQNRCILLSGGGPSPSPYGPAFDRTRVPRITPAPDRIEQWIEKMVPDGNYAPMVSAGPR